ARQADVGRQVGEAGIEAKEPGKEQAEGKMEAVERAAADEHPYGHGCCQPFRRGAFRAQLVEEIAKTFGEAGLHGSLSRSASFNGLVATRSGRPFETSPPG